MFISVKIIGASVNPDEYHKIDEPRGSYNYPASSSMLKVFNRCAKRWRDGYTSPDSKATRFGSLLDCLALTPNDFARRFAVQPDKYTTTGMQCPECKSITDSAYCKACSDKTAKILRVKVDIEKDWNNTSTTCRAWTEEHKGLTIVTSDELNDALAASRALHADPRIDAMLNDSDKQVWLSGFWQDAATGLLIPVQALLDAVPRPDTAFYKNIVDVKTDRNAALGAWTKKVFDYGYHVQGAFNLDLYRAARPQEDRVNFCHIVIENYAPFQVGRRILSESFLEIGRATYKRALANYAYCLKNNHWPDYDEGDDSVQGWTITEPRSWMGDETIHAQRFGDETPEEVAEEDSDVPH